MRKGARSRHERRRVAGCHQEGIRRGIACGLRYETRAKRSGQDQKHTRIKKRATRQSCSRGNIKKTPSAGRRLPPLNFSHRESIIFWRSTRRRRRASLLANSVRRSALASQTAAAPWSIERQSQDSRGGTGDASDVGGADVATARFRMSGSKQFCKIRQTESSRGNKKRPGEGQW